MTYMYWNIGGSSRVSDGCWKPNHASKPLVILGRRHPIPHPPPPPPINLTASDLVIKVGLGYSITHVTITHGYHLCVILM